ncbi:MAG: UDP-N-acetylglucosamine 1-carboxyvinyltransferase [Candidatus Neomarinimicrobiota bacterium]|jgi:UDP-N-acetylglucosamine 1-carboxyvinyltransferase|nr:UDP-N-acetylglucosamine 1-carboxyvinyltransferase [Candidatus Neomarinimicrobiota bacterium]
MDKIIVDGGKQLNGKVKIGGAKNAVLPIMTACILAPGKYTITNVPDLRDTRTMSELLRRIGADVKYENNILQINTENCNSPEAPYELVKTMRASFYVLGPLLSRFGISKVSLPGGCAWGPRPVNYHIEALEKLGANIQLNNGYIIAKGNLKGEEITFKNTSVGATGNTLMAAVKANGTTIINNAAIEPEISLLCNFLNKMGAEISGVGTKTLTIRGVTELKSVNLFKIIPDRIEAGTFLIATAMTGGSVELIDVNSNHLKCVLDNLVVAGSEIDISDNNIKIKSSKIVNSVSMVTAPYPGFPTDLQAQWMALMTISRGQSIITDEVYLDRFTHVAELNRLGANIRLNKNKAFIDGVPFLKGAQLMSTDIRASASLIISALSAQGISEISRVYHIDRGYEKIENKFMKLGANIWRESEKK